MNWGLDLIISNWKITGTAAKTFWMPDGTHATQKSSMANLSIAARTDPTSFSTLNELLFDVYEIHKYNYNKTIIYFQLELSYVNIQHIAQLPIHRENYEKNYYNILYTNPPCSQRLQLWKQHMYIHKSIALRLVAFYNIKSSPFASKFSIALVIRCST